MKQLCTKCNIEQDITNFRKDQHNSTGHASQCNTCNKENQRKYYKNNPEKVKTYAKEYYKANSSRILALRKARKNKKPTKALYKTTDDQRSKQSEYYYNREGWKKQKEKVWLSRGIKNFTYEQFEKMREAQNNRCYICNSGPANNQSLHVDHDHITGKVRKLLCNNCNNGIGKLKDSIEILNKAIKYLKEHG
jgi:hypothetical protein